MAVWNSMLLKKITISSVIAEQHVRFISLVSSHAFSKIRKLKDNRKNEMTAFRSSRFLHIGLPDAKFVYGGLIELFTGP